MNSPVQINHEDLKKVFQIEELPEYFNYQPLIDRKAGFSVLREYPANIQYKPPVTKEGRPDSVALIYVFCIFPGESAEVVDFNKIPIILKVNIYSQYLGKHFDYKFDDDDKSCPTRASVELSKQSPKPISLESIDEYTYSHSDKNLKDKNNRVVSGQEILNEIFEQHCNTVHLIKGLKIQWKMGSQRFGVKVIEVSIQLLIWLLKHLTGRIIEPDKEMFAGILKPYQKENMRLLSPDKINIFNYEASKNIIITFCCLVLLWHTLAFFFSITVPYIKSIKSDNTVLLCTAILVLWTLDHMLPKFIFWFINKLISWKLHLMFLK